MDLILQEDSTFAHGQEHLIPRMRLSKPTAGWIRWQFQFDPEPFEIKISNIFNSMEDIWFWALDLAHGFLPQTLEIDQEGSLVQLSAHPGAEGPTDLNMQIRCLDDQRKQVYFERSWFTDRVGFVQALGKLFSVYFVKAFDAKEWANGHMVPDFAGLLPWRFPAGVARASLKLGPLTQSQVDWALVRRFDPDLYPVFEVISNEDRLGFFFQLAALRQSLAQRVWHRSRPANAEGYDEAFTTHPELGYYKRAYEDAQNLLEELEMMRRGSPEYAHLANEREREFLLVEYANRLHAWECKLLKVTESLLLVSAQGSSLSLGPAWDNVSSEWPWEPLLTS